MLKKILPLILAALLLGIGFSLSTHAAEQTVYVSSAGSDENAGTLERPFASLYAAFRALPYGGKVVVCGPLTVSTTELPVSQGVITVTSVGDEDYRVSGGTGNAIINLSGNITIKSAVKFENLDICAIATNLVFICHGNYVCFGENLTITRSSDQLNYPGIVAGSTGATSSDGSFVEIYSGNWFRVRGGARGTSSAPQEGGVLLAIYGGIFNSTLDMGGDSATNCDCALLIYDGYFVSSINGASGADMKTTGDIYISVYGGTFQTGIRASRGGAIEGDVTINAFADIAKTTTIGAASEITGKLTFNTAAGVNAAASDEFTVNSLSDAEANAIRKADEARIADARASRIPVIENTVMERDFSRTGTTGKILSPTAYESIGDVNGDGHVSLADVLYALRCIFSKTYNAKADLDSSSTITLTDVLRLVKLSIHGARGFSPIVSENAFDETMTLHGGATVRDEKFSQGAVFGTSNLTDYSLLANFTLEEDAHISLYFGCDISNPESLSGYCFDVDRANNSITLFMVDGAVYRTVASRKMTMYTNEAQLLVINENGAVSLYYSDNPFDTDPYFVFNLNLTAKGNACGVYTERATASLPILSSHTPSDEKTYTNPCLEDFTDPEIYFEGGRYYVFGTANGSQNNGVKCYSTTNFRVFKDEGFAFTAGDGFGDGIFKAANVVKYGDDYYMFYMAKSEELGTTGVTAYASSKSITGPYTNPDKRPLTDSLDFIGGQPFVDADGKVYLIYARTMGGNKLYGAQLSLDGGIAKLDLSTEKLLLVATEPWENAKASVVECGYLIRHGDTYYLMYSGGNYNSTYGTGFATSKSPLGPFVKYEYNPILVSNDQAFGVGAASVFASPDGSEHFIIYLRNYSPTKVRPLCTCIDRIQFVKDAAGGMDILTVQGPSVTPQPLPANRTNTTDFPEYQTSRFVW